MDVRAHNRAAWRREVEKGNIWTVPVSPAEIEAARRGDWQIVLTPLKPVPRAWFPPDLHGRDVLCLASGGGQQGPILAAAGAIVTVLDNCPEQLQQDRRVAERDGLSLTLIEGDMADLHMFRDECFDLIVHPVSNVFTPHVLRVWQEAFRVLRKGGALLSGFCNPANFIFDYELYEKGQLEVKYAVPYSDLTSLDETVLQARLAEGEPLEFGHSLQDQIGGQIEAGFVISGFYEDTAPNDTLSKFLPWLIATKADKPL